jgi:hypothetical protein
MQDVELATIAQFNKMKTLTTDLNEIIDALQNSNLLELSPDKRKVKRNKPMEALDRGANNRTVYIVPSHFPNSPSFNRKTSPSNLLTKTSKVNSLK